MSEINNAPSLQKAINIQRAKKENSKQEIEARQVSQEASGDNQQSSVNIDSTNATSSLTEETSKDVEKAEKVLDVNRPQSLIKEEAEEKEKEINEETTKAIEAVAQEQINSTWAEAAGAAE